MIAQHMLYSHLELPMHLNAYGRCICMHTGTPIYAPACLEQRLNCVHLYGLCGGVPRFKCPLKPIHVGSPSTQSFSCIVMSSLAAMNNICFSYYSCDCL